MSPRWRRAKTQLPAPGIPAAGGSSAAEVGRDNTGTASTGAGAANVQYQAQHATVLPAEALASPASLGAPPGLGNLPQAPGMFVGRANELARLAEAVTAGAAARGRGVVAAVHWLDGVGKSTLAAHYAATHRQEFGLVWWITADSPAGIDDGLAALAAALQPAVAGLLPAEVLRERAVQWLASHDRWLVVLDNVTDPAHVRALLAQAPAGRFVITSRRATGWHGTATPVQLDVLTPGEAGQLLAAIVTAGREPRPGQLEGAAALCAGLGLLPLAIEQAGAYLAETGITPTAYMGLLAAQPASMYAQTAEDGDAQRTIARIWRVTLDQLTGTPLAGRLLRILAFYAPDGIPWALLDGLPEDPQELITAAGRLAAYSMITLKGDVLAMHRLVQAVTRTPDPADPHRTPAAVGEARDQATTLLAAAVPATTGDPADWPAWRILLPHLEALAEHTTAGTDSAITAALLDKAAAFLAGQGALARAIPLFERSLQACIRVLGDDHPDTLGSRNNLAYAYESAGDLGRAIPLYEATLQACTRVLGDDHPTTLTSRNNLAYAYESAGDLGRAIPLYEATLQTCTRVLGDDHPDTLTSRNNLAYAYESARDLSRAIPLYEATLADRRRVLGDDHPDTLSSCSNLAYAYRVAGDLDRAIPLYEATLADRRRVLGDDHPDTLGSCSNLAYAYESAGDLGRAIPLYEATLQACTRVLGDDHPNTLTLRNNLAYAYESAGDLGRAIPLYEATLADRRRVLGDDQPDTLGSRSNLAYAYESAGDLGRAIPLYEATLPACTRVLGDDHPMTVTVRRHLQALTGVITR
jgi:tetratricopeptide (TPR) repeat protein